ncbi:hypothetical protein [Nonomuraea endophytica]|uniref:Uncharacterized protein n=1 Tax=Nonomuraea endophytica TaxID=714136 RepID=A0A7W8A2N8_9ACTN|nr:hypothetical protein [Nonomuraea endophytica]MBB5077869.1 hypothetical protein [Nonomuraea endophytica]
MLKTILAASVIAGAIPQGFLLYEKDAAKKDKNPETNWAVSKKKTAKSVVNPCDRAALGQAGRTSAKTIIYTAVPDYSKSEQLILYTDATSAGAALAGIKSAAASCGTKGYRFSARAVKLGDAALAVTGQSYYKGKAAVGGERAIVVRRANALIVYTQAGEWGKPATADFTRQTQDAKRMLAKVCQIASC